MLFFRKLYVRTKWMVANAELSTKLHNENMDELFDSFQQVIFNLP